MGERGWIEGKLEGRGWIEKLGEGVGGIEGEVEGKGVRLVEGTVSIHCLQGG